MRPQKIKEFKGLACGKASGKKPIDKALFSTVAVWEQLSAVGIPVFTAAP
jgi:hypothetical protein